MLRQVIFSSLICIAPLLAIDDAMAACSIPTSLSLTQSNGYTVNIYGIIQSGNNFNGYAVTNNNSGHVQGRLNNKGILNFTIFWGGGSSVGEYTAFVDDEDGSVTGGSTFDKRTPRSTAVWSTRQRFYCY